MSPIILRSRKQRTLYRLLSERRDQVVPYATLKAGAGIKAQPGLNQHIRHLRRVLAEQETADEIVTYNRQGYKLQRRDTPL